MKRVIAASSQPLTSEQRRQGIQLKNALINLFTIIDDPAFDPGNEFDILQNDPSFYEDVESELRHVSSILETY